MSELLNLQDVTVVGLLIVACIYLARMMEKSTSKFLEKNERDYREMKEERTQERKEWLKALNDNTEQLKNVAAKLEVIPKLQDDVEEIKEKLGGLSNVK